VKSGLTDLVPIDQAIIDSLIAANPSAKLLSVLFPFYNRLVNIRELCSFPPPEPEPLDPVAYTAPLTALNDIQKNLYAVLWSLWCQCSECPPLSGCTGDNHFDVVPTDGWLQDEAAGQWRYRALSGATTYVKYLVNGTCYGPFNGVYISWNTNATYDPNQGCQICNYDGTGCVSFNMRPPGNQFTLRVYVGEGSGSGPVYPWPPNDFSVTAGTSPPGCDPEALCTSIEYISNQVALLTEYNTNAADSAGQVGVPDSFVLPGMDNLTGGTITQLLQQIALYLAPITPDQLVSPTVQPVTESGTVLIGDAAFVSIELVTVPDTLSVRGVEAPVYYSSYRSPGPGWVLVYGATGVIGYYPLTYPDGLQIVWPGTATHLAIELLPGTEIAVTSYLRSIT